MRVRSTRRQFLVTVGAALELAAVAGAAPRGARRLFWDDAAGRLGLGRFEALAGLLLESEPEEVLPRVARELREGLPLSDLVAATALVNARALGGSNYNGFHALMALMPSYEMALQGSGPDAVLPVLKVVQRNLRFIAQAGMRERDTLAPVRPAQVPGDLLRQVRSGDLDAAHASLSARLEGPLIEAYEELQELVRQEADVHRVVLSWRAFDLLRLAGEEHAATLLRQELLYCANADAGREGPDAQLVALVPTLLERHGLAGRERGKRVADDAWIAELAAVVFESERAQAADAVARGLAQGFDAADVCRALALCTARIVQQDPGRGSDSPGLPVGSVHGANYGVHSSDAANAWRHIAGVGSARHAHATLIAAAYHTAVQPGNLLPEAFDAQLEPPTEADAGRLLARIEGSLREGDAAAAGAHARRYTDLGHAPQALLDLAFAAMLEQDGALHAEKYLRTVQEEHALARPRHGGAQLVALIRVAASGAPFASDDLQRARAALG